MSEASAVRQAAKDKLALTDCQIDTFILEWRKQITILGTITIDLDPTAPLGLGWRILPMKFEVLVDSAHPNGGTP